MIIVFDMQYLTFINIKSICDFTDQLTKLSRLDCNCIFFGRCSYSICDIRVVDKCWYLTSEAFIDIININKKKMESSTEPCGTPFITSHQLGDL